MCMCVSCSVITPWTIACQAPLSMEFSRQEYWSGWLAIPFSRESFQSRNQTLLCIKWSFLGGSAVKNIPATQETQIRSLGQEDPLAKEM